VYTRPFILAAAANFLFCTNLNAYTLLPLYIQRLGGREGEIGSIMAMYSLAATLAQLGVGALVDRGRKPVMVAATGLIVTVSGLFLFTGALGWHFYVLRFLQGMAWAGFITSNLTLLADLAPPGRRAEAVGIFGVSGLVTIALAPAAGEIILRAWGFRALFGATVLVALAAAGLVLAMSVPPPAPVEAQARLGLPFWWSYRPVLVAALAFGLANSMVFVFLPPFAREIALPRIGPFYIVYTAAAVAVRFFGGALADRWGRRQVILPSMVAMAAGILLFSLLRGTPLLLLIALLNGAAHGFIFPAASALAFDLAPAGARGKALAAFNTAALTGTTAGALGFGWLAEFAGYRPAFLIMGLFLLAVSAAFAWRR
jgi:MFS family permease